MTNSTETLDVQGVVVRVESDQPAFLSAVVHDFHFFRAAGASGRGLRVRTFPAAARPGDWRVRFRRGRSAICAAPSGERRVITYGAVWTIYRYDDGVCDLYGDDPETLYEVFYFAVLTFVGAKLDERGLHRVHGLGLSVDGKGLLLMAPSGTGKSTLAMKLMSQSRIGLLSDDTPLVDSSGRMHAFPLRMAVKEKPALPDELLRFFRRHRAPSKYIVRSDVFAPLLRPSAPLRWIVELRRDHAPSPRFEAQPRWRMIGPLFRWLVIGFETQQAWEFFFRATLGDVGRKGKIVLHRLRAAFSVFLRARFYRFHLSDDPSRCFEALAAFPTD